MNKDQLIFQFSQAAINAITAQDIRDAIASLPAGGVEQIADYITVFCRSKGIDPQSEEIAEYYKLSEEYKAIQEEQLAQKETDNEINNLEGIVNNYRENIENGILPTKEQRIEISEQVMKSATKIGINTKNETGIINASELLKMKFSPINWIVPGLIGEGLTILAGAPKIGKSWFVLGLAINTSLGKQFLDIQTKKSTTLYISLEDSLIRLKTRLQVLKAPETIDNLKISTEWSDKYNGLNNFLENNPNINMVIIDTLGRFANIDDMNDYSKTTNALAGLKMIADKRRISIIVVHHARKGENKEAAKNDPVEAVLGSTGLTGAVDCTITLGRHRQRDKVNHEGFLYATGRDNADITKKLILDINNGGWSLKNMSKEPDHSMALGETKEMVYKGWK